MFVHIKFISAPRWHMFCIQKSYRLHKFVSQATPQNKAVTRDQDSKPENKPALTRNSQNDHANLTIQFK